MLALDWMIFASCRNFFGCPRLPVVVTTNLDLVVDTNYFPNTKNDQYWSNQTYAPVRLRAWYLYFSDGSTGSTIKEAPNYVRLVADGESL